MISAFDRPRANLHHHLGVIPFLGAAGLQGAVSLLPDYLLFVCLFAVGVTQLRETRVPEPATVAA